ncbi:MAG: FHA domain-containing protein [Kofleriaceae bacterium]
MPRLLWRDAQGIEGSLDLAAAEIKVGRAMDCAIRTDDAMVSRHHARVFWGGGGYVLEDLSSANGVFFQEQRIQNHLFKHGDAIRCGSLWLRFVDTNQLAMSPPPGSGPIPPGGPTGHLAAMNPAAVAAVQPQHPPLSTPVPSGPVPGSPGAASHDADNEIKTLRRRIDQLQAELRVFRTNRFTAETAQRMEDLENDLATLQIERDNLKQRMERAEHQLIAEGGSVKVKRALEIATAAAETVASLNDLLSSLRIDVMAAQGEFDQYAQHVPRASFELIRQSLRDAAARCDEARNLLRRLREVAE